MHKKLLLISLSLWIGTIGVFLFFFIRGNTKQSTDNRKAILLSAYEKNIVLGEMRTVLKAVNGTLRAVGENNFKEASTAAGMAGAKMAVDVNPVLMAKLPLEFKKLGLSMHADFDVLSKDLSSGLNQAGTVKRLGEITNKCVACHATYRIQETETSSN